jgi:hypothetical protein
MDEEISNQKNPNSANTPPPVPEKPRKKIHLSLPAILVILFILIVTVLSIGTLFYEKSINNSQSNQSTITKVNKPTLTPKEKNSGEDIITELGENLMSYYSPTLGIKFNYINNADGTPISVERLENIVCVTVEHEWYKNDGTQDDFCPHGQSVEIFSKDPSISLSNAIENKFLVGYDKKECFVELLNKEGKKAIISYPTDNRGSDDPWWVNSKNCPHGYSKANGIRYFYYDNNFPEKYAFFDIGQYYIDGANNGETTWQDTFKFTN